jgi:hypothetical protein
VPVLAFVRHTFVRVCGPGELMLTKRYMTSVKNLPKIMEKIVEGTAPKKFTIAHLKSIGFTSSNDVGAIGLLKDLGFLSQDGTPTQRYHDYRDKSRSKIVMAEGTKGGLRRPLSY